VTRAKEQWSGGQACPDEGFGSFEAVAVCVG
jgi:hypothetical protein